MLEIDGDIWDYHKKGEYVVITTNGFVKNNGECVMGGGVAYDAKTLYPSLPKRLGLAIKKYGNIPFCFKEKIITFPTKHNWWEKSDLKLIEKSAILLKQDINNHPHIEHIYMVRPGCSNGKLDWETQVKNIIKNILDDRFIVVEKYK